MFQLFLTDFIKSRNIQLFALWCLIMDLLLAQSITHAVGLLGLPYITSVGLSYFLPSAPKSNRTKARVSKQFKNSR